MGIDSNRCVPNWELVKISNKNFIMRKLNTIARIENDFIFNAQYQLTAKEQKIILFLIANINPAKQKKFELQVIPVKKLRWAIMGDGKNGSFYEEMKKLAFRLVKKGIVFDTDVLIEGRMFPGYVNWFQSIGPIKNEINHIQLLFLFFYQGVMVVVKAFLSINKFNATKKRKTQYSSILVWMSIR